MLQTEIFHHSKVGSMEVSSLRIEELNKIGDLNTVFDLIDYSPMFNKKVTGKTDDEKFSNLLNRLRITKREEKIHGCSKIAIQIRKGEPKYQKVSITNDGNTFTKNRFMCERCLIYGYPLKDCQAGCRRARY